MRNLLLPLGLLLAGPAAATDVTVPFTGVRTNYLELHLGLQTYGFGATLGGRYGVPVMQNGFIPTIDNSLYINFGVDLYSAYNDTVGRRGVAFGIPIAVQWNVNFTEEWSAFAEIGANIYVGPGVLNGNGTFSPNVAWLVLALGARYHLSEQFALHLRIGAPYTSIGIEFQL